jgi:ribosome-associated protein
MRLCYNSIEKAWSYPLKAIDTARRIVEIAADKLAGDITLLDTRGICGFADYFVIVSGESERQLAAIADEIVQSLKKAGAAPFRREGAPTSGWILLDYGDVIVHIFSTAERDYYQLEQMWSGAKPVVRIA